MSSNYVSSSRRVPCQAFYKRVANDLAELGLRKPDVVINLVEVAKENWSFGDGEMHCGPTYR